MVEMLKSIRRDKQNAPKATRRLLFFSDCDGVGLEHIFSLSNPVSFQRRFWFLVCSTAAKVAVGCSKRHFALCVTLNNNAYLKVIVLRARSAFFLFKFPVKIVNVFSHTELKSFSNEF